MSDSPVTEQRRFRRIPFDAIARLAGKDGTWETRVADLSLKGVLIELPAERACTPGESYLLEVELVPEALIRMQTVVVHCGTGRVGLRCEHIDVESITLLRRLVELNTADPELLERELAALG
jgi:hypothetical protein